MEKQREVDALRELLAHARPNGQRHFPVEVRSRLQEFIGRQLAAGQRITDLAEALGLGTSTVSYFAGRWGTRSKSRAQKFEQVRVVAEEGAPGAVILHGPHGVRVEGLSTEQLADVLRRLP